MRLFVAINLPAGQREAIHGAAAPLRDAAPWVSWTPADRLHLTVKFIGERDDAEVPALQAALAEAAAPHMAMELEMRGVGAFPNFRRPHVVWLGVEPHPRLELLHHDIELACERVGIEVEGRPFKPHLTLGRIARGARPGDRDALRSLAAARRLVTLRTEIRVDSVDLMRSDLRPQGAVHSLVAAAPLGAA